MNLQTKLSMSLDDLAKLSRTDKGKGGGGRKGGFTAGTHGDDGAQVSFGGKQRSAKSNSSSSNDRSRSSPYGGGGGGGRGGRGGRNYGGNGGSAGNGRRSAGNSDGAWKHDLFGQNDTTAGRRKRGGNFNNFNNHIHNDDNENNSDQVDHEEDTRPVYHPEVRRYAVNQINSTISMAKNGIGRAGTRIDETLPIPSRVSNSSPLPSNILSRLGPVLPEQHVAVDASNLSQAVALKDLQSLFGSVGKVESLTLTSEGSAHVVYATKEAALASIREFNNRLFDGLPLSVKISPKQDSANNQPQTQMQPPARLGKNPF